MKRIVFVLSFSSLGGIEKSLINLLYNFDFSKYKVDIALLNKEGELVNCIPQQANIIDVNCFKGEIWQLITNSPYYNLKHFLTKLQFLNAICYCFFYFLNKKTNNSYRVQYLKWVTRKINKLPYKYDVAIAYGGPEQLMDFYVCHKINATKKIGWIHFDINKFHYGKKTATKFYDKYSKICVVSNEAKFNFMNHFPQFKDKVITFYNKINTKSVIASARQENIFPNDKSIKLLTVGRIREEKGQTLALRSLEILINKGYNVKWYFVGDGPDKIHCENLAEELGISERAVFVGNKINPYVYMKSCNIYVQPSLHEGFCMTLAEALCFKNPIVTTNFAGAREQLVKRSNAIITEANPILLSNSIIKAMDLPQIEDEIIIKSNDNLTDLYDLLDE